MKILWQSTGFFLLCASLLAAGRGEAAQAPLQVITESRVDPDGRVQVWLTLKNRGSEPLLKVQPLFHFHHSRSPMSPIQRLEPGQEITLENTGHPPVRRAGR
nr:hypothetical protein [Nitrospinaceae bacterium]NIR54768.1 hypothetical protein [Nitrospinaceae bacterium]NIS85194.1 hypothetical protein [Nitrospinaceae bacterium]NIT82004.1 hypothetical protein [Nitrospinaceae bacterium]NIU96398.1 hypothetical protein [Nitrospinaceae bacterium]